MCQKLKSLGILANLFMCQKSWGMKMHYVVCGSIIKIIKYGSYWHSAVGSYWHSPVGSYRHSPVGSYRHSRLNSGSQLIYWLLYNLNNKYTYNYIFQKYT